MEPGLVKVPIDPDRFMWVGPKQSHESYKGEVGGLESKEGAGMVERRFAVTRGVR